MTAAVNVASLGTAMSADSSGNVGIGTSSPARKLQVHEATAATNAYIQLSNAATGATSTDGFQLIVGTGGETILAQRENAEMQFWTNNTEQARLTAAGLLQFNSGYGSAAVAYGCRAWVNFNGTGTVAINASGNVSSITDNGTGDYTVNFTTAMPDANYSIGGMNSSWVQNYSTRATSSIRVITFNSVTGGNLDVASVSIHIFR